MAPKRKKTRKRVVGASNGGSHHANESKDPTGRGGRAVGIDEVIKTSNITRLKRAEGQVRGVARMVTEDRYCTDIIIQIAAAQESLRAVAKNLLKNHLKHCAKAALQASQAEADAMCTELVDVMSKIAK